jgi:hypothetical protein
MFNSSMIREIKFKTTVRYHLTLIKVVTIEKKKTRIGKDMRKLQPLCIGDGKVK